MGGKRRVGYHDFCIPRCPFGKSVFPPAPSPPLARKVVSNQRNGVDVDKLDYFLRDSTSALGESSPLVHVQRLIDATAVFKDPKTGETTVRERASEQACEGKRAAAAALKSPR